MLGPDPFRDQYGSETLSISLTNICNRACTGTGTGTYKRCIQSGWGRNRPDEVGWGAAMLADLVGPTASGRLGGAAIVLVDRPASPPMLSLTACTQAINQWIDFQALDHSTV